MNRKTFLPPSPLAAAFLGLALGFFVCRAHGAPVSPEREAGGQQREEAEAGKQSAWDGSRTTAVHFIPLKDSFDQVIVPTSSYPLPFSARNTCAPCHDYTIVRRGLHSNATLTGTHGRRGEPWVWVDPRSGTVLPLSYRGWEGTWNPRELGLSAWDFTLLFGRHMTGGGISEPDDAETSPESRWNVSGKLELNCLGCHNASRRQSHSEWAKQVLRQNYRWAATAASGLGEVGGMASRLPPTWDLFDGPNPDDTEWAVVPFVRYRKELFGRGQRVFLDIAPEIDDQRCLACHSVTPVGATRVTAEEDVHSAAGIRCVDCHRNDVRHTMVRGYEREAEDYGEPERSLFSCRGCHTGGDPAGKKDGTSGRLGAPYPRHKGIPAVHFEKLACTACHSGPLPGPEPVRVRTSRANRLGIYGIARWAMEWPHIAEPVPARDGSGKIAPHRLLWPSYWVRLEGEKAVPLKPDEVLDSAGGVLTVEEDVARILKALTLFEADGIPVLVLGGKAYRVNVDNLLDVRVLKGEEEEPGLLWAVEKEGRVESMIPRFDPDAEEVDADAEAKIQLALEALSTVPGAPGPPGILYRSALYRLADGYLEKCENPGPSTERAVFVWIEDGGWSPVVTDFQARTVSAVVGTVRTLTKEQVRMVLERLAADFPSTGEAAYGYISGGRLFILDGEGALVPVEHPAAGPVLWPLGHQVRPAQQSLGANGCTDCHSERSPFFFGRVTADGPLLDESAPDRPAYAFMGLDQPYQRLFGLSFRGRSLLKWILLAAGFVVGSLLLLMFFLVLGKATGLIEGRR